MAYTEDTPVALLPKVDSDVLMKAIEGMPCSLRIASFIFGFGCADQATVVGVHFNTPQKGKSTKSTGLAVAAGCKHCHDLVDRVDPRINDIEKAYPAALGHRYLQGLIETQSRLYEKGIITVKGDKNGGRK